MGWFERRHLAEPSPEGEVERDAAGRGAGPGRPVSVESAVSARMDVALLAKLRPDGLVFDWRGAAEVSVFEAVAVAFERKDFGVVHESVVDYCSLQALLSVGNGFYPAGPRRARYVERIGRRRLLEAALLPSIAIAILLVVVPSQRYILWWIPAIQAGLIALLATIAFPFLVLRRRGEWPQVQPHERRAMPLVMGLLVLSALAPPIGILLLTLAIRDFWLAFALSLTAAYLLHWTWVLVVRPGAQDPAAGSATNTAAGSASL